MTGKTHILESLLEKASSMPSAEIPAFLGGLETVRITAMARLTLVPAAPRQADELLGIDEAARRLGVTKSFLYHRKTLPFVRRMGRRLLFSARGIEVYINKTQI